MKTPVIAKAAAIATALAALIAAGCAGPGVVSQNAEGPLAEREPAGTLVVYSARRISTFEDSPDYSHYTWYSVRDQRGRLLENVPASVDDIFPRPRPVQLPAGRYIVNALDASSKRVSVPVTIRSRELTVLHLDRGDRGISRATILP
jgi:hypothetical protein